MMYLMLYTRIMMKMPEIPWIWHLIHKYSVYFHDQHLSFIFNYFKKLINQSKKQFRSLLSINLKHLMIWILIVLNAIMKNDIWDWHVNHQTTVHVFQVVNTWYWFLYLEFQCYHMMYIHLWTIYDTWVFIN